MDGERLTLFTMPGSGSAIIEAQLAWLNLDHRLEDVGDIYEDAAAREKLAQINPLAQVPTLRLPDGTVLTESAAITLFLADFARRDDLVPGPRAPERAGFLRWLIFLVANLYPTFAYADKPERVRGWSGCGRALPGAGRRPCASALFCSRAGGGRALVPRTALQCNRPVCLGVVVLATGPNLAQSKHTTSSIDRGASGPAYGFARGPCPQLSQAVDLVRQPRTDGNPSFCHRAAPLLAC